MANQHTLRVSYIEALFTIEGAYILSRATGAGSPYLGRLQREPTYYEISSYPTIILFVNGESTHYEGNLTIIKKL